MFRGSFRLLCYVSALRGAFCGNNSPETDELHGTSYAEAYRGMGYGTYSGNSRYQQCNRCNYTYDRYSQYCPPKFEAVCLSGFATICGDAIINDSTIKGNGTTTGRVVDKAITLSQTGTTTARMTVTGMGTLNGPASVTGAATGVAMVTGNVTVTVFANLQIQIPTGSTFNVLGDTVTVSETIPYSSDITVTGPTDAIVSVMGIGTASGVVTVTGPAEITEILSINGATTDDVTVIGESTIPSGAVILSGTVTGNGVVQEIASGY